MNNADASASKYGESVLEASPPPTDTQTPVHSPGSQDSSTQQSPTAKKYTTSIFCGNDDELTQPFVDKIQELEKILKRPVFLILEGSTDGISVMSQFVYRWLLREKSLIPKQPIAILLDSRGGVGKSAFKLAMLLKKHCGSFFAVVPRIAKSAATLFSLGAEKIILGEHAELGPLDAQFEDKDIEEDWVSALDTVQAVEQLEESAIEVAVRMLKFLGTTTGKKYNVLLPHALHFAAEITQPLFNKIDAVRYSRQHRILREAQDYAERLLQDKDSTEKSAKIAKDLVRRYPTHDYVIDRKEAMSLGELAEDGATGNNRNRGLSIVDQEVPQEVNEILEWLSLNVADMLAIGTLEEIDQTVKK